MSTCRWISSTQPRVLTERHEDHCGDVTCAGCLPCTEPHCRVCGRAHAEQTCAECVAEARADLREIARLCDELPEEVEHRGINGEAMMLLGPVANPESIGHVRASIAAGRLPADWLDNADGELHPLTVTWWWNECYREAFEHDESEKADLGDLIEYLDRNLYRASEYADVPFEDLARDLRKSRAHLESVLHDGEQVEKGAPCQTCKRPMERVAVEGPSWFTCTRCDVTLDEESYRLAVHRTLIARASLLNADDMAVRIEIPASTIRRWASKRTTQREGEEPVEHKALLRPAAVVNGRKVYSVERALRIRDAGGDTRGRLTEHAGAKCDTVSNDGGS